MKLLEVALLIAALMLLTALFTFGMRNPAL